MDAPFQTFEEVLFRCCSFLVGECFLIREISGLRTVKIAFLLQS